MTSLEQLIHDKLTKGEPYWTEFASLLAHAIVERALMMKADALRSFVAESKAGEVFGKVSENTFASLLALVNQALLSEDGTARAT